MSRVLITGAARRLGAAMATHLAKQGHEIIIHYHQSEADAKALQSSLRDGGAKVEIIRADIEDDAQALALIARAVAIGGPIDILINNASSFEYDQIGGEKFDHDLARRNLRTNLEAPLILSHEFARQCAGRRPSAGGQIVNMIDQRVLGLTPHYSSYSIAKSGLLALTKQSAMALAPNIRVNAIGPGTPIPSETGQRKSGDKARAPILRAPGEVDDILQALDYILAAKALTGQMICPDGGKHLAGSFDPDHEQK